MTGRVRGWWCGGAAALGVVALAAGALVGGGCAAWGNYPPIGDDYAVNNPNTPPMPTVAAEAVRWVARKYPVDGEFVVNLPRGMERETAEKVLARIGLPGARLVSPQTVGLPAYHVTKVWVRESQAAVDVLRPVTDVAAETELGRGAMNYQLFTVRLEGGGLRGSWRVNAAPRAWPIGGNEPPELYGWEQEFSKEPDSGSVEQDEAR